MAAQEIRPGSLDRRSEEELNRALNLAQHTVYKQYLDKLSTYPLVAPGQLLLDEAPQKCVRLFQLTQLTCKKGEDPLQKLSTVYHAAMSLGCSLFVMVDVPGPAAPADIYLGLRNPDEQAKRLRPSYEALRDGLLSSFPGSQIREVSASREMAGKLDDIFGDTASCVTAVSCVAAVRDKSRTEHKSFIQGIEKLIDTMRGKAYTALFIAEPISPQEQAETRAGYESLYSALSSFQKSVWSYSESESHSVMESLSHGISTTITEGTSHNPEPHGHPDQGEQPHLWRRHRGKSRENRWRRGTDRGRKNRQRPGFDWRDGGFADRASYGCQPRPGRHCRRRWAGPLGAWRRTAGRIRHEQRRKIAGAQRELCLRQVQKHGGGRRNRRRDDAERGQGGEYRHRRSHNGHVIHRPDPPD